MYGEISSIALPKVEAAIAEIQAGLPESEALLVGLTCATFVLYLRSAGITLIDESEVRKFHAVIDKVEKALGHGAI